MSKNYINYLNKKVCALNSLIMSFIFSILLFVWRKDSSKTFTINSIDKLVNSIFNIFVLLKNKFCYKKEANVTAEPEKEISQIKKGRAFLNVITERKDAIDNLNKFIADNINSQDIKINEEVNKAKELLSSIKRQVQNFNFDSLS